MAIWASTSLIVTLAFALLSLATDTIPTGIIGTILIRAGGLLLYLLVMGTVLEMWR